jgi:hypothetical protein
MAQMSAAQIREIASDIQAELKKIAELEQQIKTTRLQMAANPDLTMIFYESLALKLHNFYTGCERIFQIVASDLNGGLPTSFDWHRRLLDRMAISHPDRPALLSNSTAQRLEEYLAFRHVVRNIYGFELKPERLEKLIAAHSEVWQQFDQDIQIFIGWLNQLSDQLESEP